MYRIVFRMYRSFVWLFGLKEGSTTERMKRMMRMGKGKVILCVE